MAESEAALLALIKLAHGDVRRRWFGGGVYLALLGAGVVAGLLAYRDNMVVLGVLLTAGALVSLVGAGAAWAEGKWRCGRLAYAEWLESLLAAHMSAEAQRGMPSAAGARNGADLGPPLLGPVLTAATYATLAVDLLAGFIVLACLLTPDIAAGGGAGHSPYELVRQAEGGILTPEPSAGLLWGLSIAMIAMDIVVFGLAYGSAKTGLGVRYRQRLGELWGEQPAQESAAGPPAGGESPQVAPRAV